MMKQTDIYTFKGMVTQDEFNTRCGYIRMRIVGGYTQEEVSFLMGKHPYYYIEFEEMKESNFTENDRSALSSIYGFRNAKSFNFERDDYGHNCKRLVKGKKEEISGVIHHTLEHPWFSIDKEKGIKRNAPVLFKEISFKVEEPQQEAAILSFKEASEILLQNGYFNETRMPLHIYERITLSSHDLILRPIYLKKVLYEYIGKHKLQIKTINNQIHYHA